MGKKPWWSIVYGVGSAILVTLAVITAVWNTAGEPRVKEVAAEEAVAAVHKEVPRIDSSLAVVQRRLDKNNEDHEKITGDLGAVKQDMEDLKKMQLITMTPEQRREFSHYLMGRRP